MKDNLILEIIKTVILFLGTIVIVYITFFLKR